MSELGSAHSLFPDMQEGSGRSKQSHTGILPSHILRELIRSKEISALREIEPRQIQPASLDLRLGAKAHRVRASFLPGPRKTVAEKIKEFSLHEIDLTDGAVLETGCVYVVRLEERLDLSSRIFGWANPKSSIGRLDVFTRLITDYAEEFDRVTSGHTGPLYAEVSPQTFSILVRQGSRLNQLRLRRGSPVMSDAKLQALHEEIGLVGDGLDQKKVRKATLDLTIDLAGDSRTRLVGFKAKKHAALVDIDAVSVYEPEDFWDPIHATPSRQLILDPSEFYILASKEPVKIPPEYAAEMVAYDTQVGEFRAHYAGFFDPGFGYRPGNGPGTRAVLEVRSHKVPFILEDGQLVGRLVYERMTDRPEHLYGEDVGSSYQEQGLNLSKHFKPFDPTRR
jgi:dCTP deaminase